MSKIFEAYQKLSNAFGPSGREQTVCEEIRRMTQNYCDESTIDTMGNLICHKKGNGKKIMLAAHMDSIGVVATFIAEDGFIRFAAVGGLSVGDLLNIQVRFANGTCGVISFEEKTPLRELTINHLFIDIGAKSREQAQELVTVGDFAVYHAPSFIQGDTICGSYLDNRIGCVALILAMEQLTQTENDLYFVFTAQEEVGLRGAGAAAYAIEPDYAIAVDVTDTGDLPEHKYPMAVKMGEGPAIKVMDRSVLCAAEVRQALEAAAQKLAIPVQQEILQCGGTDTAAVQRVRSGVPSGAVSIPTRYIHSPSEMCSACDVERAAALLAATACEVL